MSDSTAVTLLDRVELLKPEPRPTGHACKDYCRAGEAWRTLWHAKPHGRDVLALLHVCGPQCPVPVDSGGPVLLGRRGEAVTPGKPPW